MELLPIALPLFALALVALAASQRRAAVRWLARAGGRPVATGHGSGVLVSGAPDVVLVPLAAPALRPSLIVDVDARVPRGELKARLRARRVRACLAELAEAAAVRRVLVDDGKLRLLLAPRDLAASALPVVERARALALALEEASPSAIDGEGPATGTPVAVRAIDG